MGVRRTTEDSAVRDDVLHVLVAQHARLRALLVEVEELHGRQRRRSFEQLRALAAVHETAEQFAVRLLTPQGAMHHAETRAEEEVELFAMLATLERLPFDGSAFDRCLAAFVAAARRHMDAEERDVFPAIEQSSLSETRQDMGRRMLDVEHLAHTHPHPSDTRTPPDCRASGSCASIGRRTIRALLEPYAS